MTPEDFDKLVRDEAERIAETPNGIVSFRVHGAFLSGASFYRKLCEEKIKELEEKNAKLRDFIEEYLPDSAHAQEFLRALADAKGTE